MQSVKLIPVILCVVGLLVGLVPASWGGGGNPAPGDLSCLLQNPGGGALAIAAVFAIEIVGGSPQMLDVTVRAKRSGNTVVERGSFPSPVDLTSGVFSNEEFVCFALDDVDSPFNNTAFVSDLKTALGLPATTRFGITTSSVSNTEGGGEIDTTGRYSGIADVVLYACENGFEQIGTSQRCF